MAASVTSRTGCDLEYAIKTPDGKFIPAGVLPCSGRKGDPEFIKTGGMEIDCCALELTMPPADNEDKWANNILNHLNAVKEKYSSYCSLHTTPSVRFNLNTLKSIRFASEMGCDPDYNVW